MVVGGVEPTGGGWVEEGIEEGEGGGVVDVGDVVVGEVGDGGGGEGEGGVGRVGVGGHGEVVGGGVEMSEVEGVEGEEGGGVVVIGGVGWWRGVEGWRWGSRGGTRRMRVVWMSWADAWITGWWMDGYWRGVS
uniref:hypothetical protein n=1 Tax=Kocuria rhizophila TaxID=72000 RepID=UPI001C92F987